MKNLQIELIIFDLDGTLVETRQDLTDAVNYTMLRFGYQPLSLEQVCGFVGDGIQKLIERSFPDFNTEEVKSAQQIFSDYYSVHLTDNSCLYPGIIDFLKQNRHLEMAVLSNKAHSFTEKLIRQLSIDSYFSVVLGNKDDIPRKPEPDAILYILEKLKKAKTQSIIIGDTKNDILAGKAAGIFTCAVTYGFRSKESLTPYNADFIVDTPLELLNLFHSFKNSRT